MNYVAINKAAWDKRTRVHMTSEFYDLEGFLDGRSSLNEIELNEVGQVQGKNLLHLQCHFGLDTLSWARLGADVTGIDLSSEAIKQADALALKLGIKARFICDEVCNFGTVNTRLFDIVYTSYGVLCWLADLDQWAATVAGALKPGGQFNLVEFHGVNDLLNGYAYFPSDIPDVEVEGTYTENCTGEKSTVVTWPHAVSEVINALIKVGIVIESFNEFVFSPYQCAREWQYVAGKGYQMCFKGQQVPLLYSIKGRKI